MDIVLTGSVAYDYIMSFPGHFRDHILPDRLDSISLSFLVDSLVKRRGGVAPNIAYNLALFGARPRLFATVGEDFEEYFQWLDDQGVDVSLVRVIPGEFTASFFANTDQSNAQIASFYPGAMAYAAELSIHELGAPLPDLVVISPNEPAAMIRFVEECRELNLDYIYDPSQQIVRLNADAIRRGIEGAQALFVNEYEFSLIQNKTALTMQEILSFVRILVITQGEQGAVVHDEEREYHIPVVPPEKIVDPTGVGDAFRGGFLTGYARGWGLELCGQMGSLAATYCLEQRGSQGHCYTPREFVGRFRNYFDDRNILDELLR